MGIIRFYLALVVACSHFQQLLFGPVDLSLIHHITTLGMNAGWAIFFFYVISGFLISFVLDKKYSPTLEGNLYFYKARLTRIYSLYWPIYFFSAVILFPRPYEGSSYILDKITSIFLLGVDWRVTFVDYPNSYFPFPIGLNAAWTLGVEMLFYMIAPFLLRSFSAVIFVFLLSVSVRIPAAIFELGISWTYMNFSTTICFFLLGHLSYRYSQYLVINPKRNSFIFLGSSIFFLMIAANTGKFENIYFYISITLFSLGLPSIFSLTKDNKYMNFLGNLSFPIYLIHILCLLMLPSSILNSLISLFSDKVLACYVSIILYLISVTIVAIPVFLLIERPTAFLFHKVLDWGKEIFSAIYKTLKIA